jgi:hypothetical protein
MVEEAYKQGFELLRFPGLMVKIRASASYRAFRADSRKLPLPVPIRLLIIFAGYDPPRSLERAFLRRWSSSWGRLVRRAWLRK